MFLFIMFDNLFFLKSLVTKSTLDLQKVFTLLFIMLLLLLESIALFTKVTN